jgi:hypothetical protein
VGTLTSWDTLRMRWVRWLWYWISVSPMTVSEVPLTLVLMETYTTLITYIIDRSLNEVADDKIRKYRDDYNNNPPNTVSFIPTIVSTSGRLHSEFQSVESDRDQFHFRRSVFTQQFKNRVGLTLGKTVVLRITLNLDGTPIISKSHTHPSHSNSQTYRLLTSSLSWGVPVPRSN